MCSADPEGPRRGGTGTANGKDVIERAGRNDIVDLVTRRNNTAGRSTTRSRSLGLNRDVCKKGDTTCSASGTRSC
jgi:hypothetical protein